MRATLEESFYNVNVTPSELWQKVGGRLELARMARKWRPMDVERAGGPSYKTVQAIDNGSVGTVGSLQEYAGALGLSIVDILHDVLASSTTALSPEAAQVVRKFNETTVAGRTALLAMANALPSAEAVTPAPLPPVGAAAPPKPPPPRPVPPGIKRRNDR